MVLDINAKRKNGIFYTPQILADFLAKRILTRADTAVFDPSYGEGSLLLAAERLMHSNTELSFEIFGCDIKPVNGLLQHIPKAHLIKDNFLNFPTTNKYSCILMNPPYVRHKQSDSEELDQYRSIYSDFSILGKKADLWTFFLVKGMLHLQEGGSIAAILPWSFLQADYAQVIREKLVNSFGEIEYLGLSTEYFDQAQERVILLWLKNYGSTCSSIKYAVSADINNPIQFNQMTSENWLLKRVTHSSSFDISDLNYQLESIYRFKKLEDFADIKIGVVTGADEYFICNKDELLKANIPKNNSVPIIKSFKYLNSLNIYAKDTTLRILKIEQSTPRLKDYLEFGKAAGYDGSAHAKNRTPWYSVKIGKTPNGFFPYRISKIPFLICSKGKIQSTNSIHRIYFKSMSEVQIKWLQVSILSVFSQLSFEAMSKTYGRGMLKLEPGLLSKALVFVQNGSEINTVYSQIEQALSSGKKEEAMNLATDFLANYIGIPESLVNQIKDCFFELQSIRLQ